MSTGRSPRVCVTRDEPRDGPLAAALRRHGLEAVACPVVSSRPPLDPAPLQLVAARLEEFDWIVVTSARAIEALSRARGPEPLPRKLRWAVVGPATRAALARQGIAARLIPDAAGAEGLLAVLGAQGGWPGSKVLIPRAAGGLPTVAAGLRALGAAVTETIAYRTVARPPRAIAALWSAARPRGAVLASPSAAEALIEGVGTAALERLDALVALGSTTGAALRDRGLGPRVPPRPSFEAAAALCAELLGASRTP